MCSGLLLTWCVHILRFEVVPLCGEVPSLCGYHVTCLDSPLSHVVYSLCYSELTSGVKHYHPGFTRPKEPVEPVLRVGPVPPRKHRWLEQKQRTI